MKRLKNYISSIRMILNNDSIKLVTSIIKDNDLIRCTMSIRMNDNIVLQREMISRGDVEQLKESIAERIIDELVLAGFIKFSEISPVNYGIDTSKLNEEDLKNL